MSTTFKCSLKSGLTSLTLPFIGSAVSNAECESIGYIFGTSAAKYNSTFIPSSLTTVVVTGGTTIGEGAFMDCSYITSITLPNTIISIEDYAFYGCTSLTGVYYNGSITSSGNYWYYDEDGEIAIWSV